MRIRKLDGLNLFGVLRPGDVIGYKSNMLHPSRIARRLIILAATLCTATALTAIGAAPRKSTAPRSVYSQLKAKDATIAELRRQLAAIRKKAGTKPSTSDGASNTPALSTPSSAIATNDIQAIHRLFAQKDEIIARLKAQINEEQAKLDGFTPAGSQPTAVPANVNTPADPVEEPAPKYQVVDLNSAIGDYDGIIADINDNGDCIGGASLGPYVRWSFYLGHGQTTATRLAGIPISINNKGDIGGSLAGYPTVWHNGVPQIAVTGIHGEVQSINDRGDIAGQKSLGDENNYTAYVQLAGKPRVDLGVLPGHRSAMASSLNNHGMLAGDAAHGKKSISDAYYWDGATLTALPTLGGNAGSAECMNDSGLIVGWSRLADGTDHPCQWLDGKITDLMPTCQNGQCSSVNNAGDIVGSYTLDKARHFALWRHGHCYNLDECLVTPGWHIWTIGHINAHGVICGAAIPDNAPHPAHLYRRQWIHRLHPILLVPVTNP